MFEKNTHQWKYFRQIDFGPIYIYIYIYIYIVISLLLNLWISLNKEINKFIYTQHIIYDFSGFGGGHHYCFRRAHLILHKLYRSWSCRHFWILRVLAFVTVIVSHYLALLIMWFLKDITTSVLFHDLCTSVLQVF